MVISLESAQQAVSYGFGNFVGGAVAYASVRELGPMLTGVVVAGRVGAAIAAEIGSMVVTEQIEALRSMGLEPRALFGRPAFRRAAGDAAAAHDLRRRRFDCRRRLDRTNLRAHLVRLVPRLGPADDQTFRTSSKACSRRSSLERSSRSSAPTKVSRRAAARPASGKSTTGAVVISIILIFMSNFLLSLLLFG